MWAMQTVAVFLTRVFAVASPYAGCAACDGDDIAFDQEGCGMFMECLFAVAAWQGPLN